MNRINILLLLLCFCSGCSLFRKYKKERISERIEFDTTTLKKQSIRKKLASELNYLQRDSSVSKVTSIIWPRGIVKISRDSGFIGEAEKIEFLGTNIHVSSAQKHLRSQKDMDSNSYSAASGKLKMNREAEASVKGSSPYLIIAAVISIGLAAFWMLKLNRR